MNSTNGPGICRRSARSRNLSESSESSCFGSDTRSVSSYNTRHFRCSVDSGGSIPTDNSPERIKRKKRRKSVNECNSEELKKIITGSNAKLSNRESLENELIRVKLKDNRTPIVLLTRLHHDCHSEPKLEEKEKEKEIEKEVEKEVEKEIEKEKPEGLIQLSGVTIPTKVDPKILKLGPVIKINKKQTEDLIEVNKRRSSRRTSIEANEHEQVKDCSDSLVVVVENALDKCAERLNEKLKSCLLFDGECTKNRILSNRDKRLPRNFVNKDINDRLPESFLKGASTSTLSLIVEESASENQFQSCKRIESSNRKKVKCSSVDQGNDKYCTNLVDGKPKSSVEDINKEHSEAHNKSVKKYSKNLIKVNEKHSQVINKSNKKYLNISSVNDEKSRILSSNEISNKQQEIACEESNKKVSENLIVNNLRSKRNLASKINDKNKGNFKDNSSENILEQHSKNVSIKLVKNIDIDSKLFTDNYKVAHKVDDKSDSYVKNAKETIMNIIENVTEEPKKCSNKLNKIAGCSKNETDSNTKVIDNVNDKRNCLNFIPNFVEQCERLPDKTEKNIAICAKNQSERSKRSTRIIDDKSNKCSENILENNKNSNQHVQAEIDKSQHVDKEFQKCSTNFSQNHKRLHKNSEKFVQSIDEKNENYTRNFAKEFENISTKSALTPVEEKSKKNSKKVRNISDKVTLPSEKDKSENLPKSHDEKLNKIPKIPIENNEKFIQHFLRKNNEKIVGPSTENNLESTKSLVENVKKQIDIDARGKSNEKIKQIHQRFRRNQINKSNEKLDENVTGTNDNQVKVKENEIFNKESKKNSKDLESNADINQRPKRNLNNKIKESAPDSSNKTVSVSVDDSTIKNEKLSENLNKNINDFLQNQNEVVKRRTRLSDKRRDSMEILIENTSTILESNNEDVNRPHIDLVKKIRRKTLLDKTEKIAENLTNTHLTVVDTVSEHCRIMVPEGSCAAIKEFTLNLSENKIIIKKPSQANEKGDDTLVENKVAEKITENVLNDQLDSSKYLTEEGKQEFIDTIKDFSQITVENKIITRKTLFHKNDISKESLANNKDSCKDLIEDKKITRNLLPEKYQRPTENTRNKCEENISDKYQKVVKECSKRQSENNKRVTRKSSPDKHERLAKNLASDNNDLSSNATEDQKQNSDQFSEKNQKRIKERSTVQNDNCRKTNRKSSINKCEEHIETEVNVSDCIENSVKKNEQLDLLQKVVKENCKLQTESNRKHGRRPSVNKHENHIESPLVNNLDTIQTLVEDNETASEKLDNKENSKTQVEMKTRITRNSVHKKERQSKNLNENNLDCVQVSSEGIKDLISECLVSNAKSLFEVTDHKKLIENSVNKISETFSEIFESSMCMQNIIEENKNELLTEKSQTNHSKDCTENKESTKIINSDTLNVQYLLNEKHSDGSQVSKKKDLSSLIGGNKRITRNMYEKISENLNKESLHDSINSCSEFSENKKKVESSGINNKTDNLSFVEMTANEYTKHIDCANDTDSLIHKVYQEELSNNKMHSPDVIKKLVEIDEDSTAEKQENISESFSIIPKEKEENLLIQVNKNESCNLKETAVKSSKNKAVNISSENQFEKCTENVSKKKKTDNVNIDNNQFEDSDQITKHSSKISKESNKAPRLSADEVYKIFNENLFTDTAKVENNKIQESCENCIGDSGENLKEPSKEIDKISDENLSYFLNGNDSLNDKLIKSSNAALSENIIEQIHENDAATPNFSENDRNCSNTFLEVDRNLDYDIIVKNHKIPVQNSYVNENIIEDNTSHIELSASTLITDNLSHGIEDSQNPIDESIANAVEEYFVNNTDETCNANSIAENSSNTALLVDLFMDQEAYAKHRRKITLMELKKKCTENLDKKTITGVESTTERLPSSLNVLEDSIPTYDNNVNNLTSTGFSSDSCVENATENEDASLSDPESEQNLADRLVQLNTLKTPPTNSIDSLDSGIQITSTPEHKDPVLEKIVLKCPRIPSFELSADFECKYCNECFVSNRELKKHVKFQHRQRLVMKITKTDSNEHVTQMLEPTANFKDKEESLVQEESNIADTEKFVTEPMSNDQITDGEIKIIVRKESGSRNSHVIKEIKITPKSSDGSSSSRSDYSGGSSFRIPGYSPVTSEFTVGNSSLIPSFSPAKVEPSQPVKRRPGRPRKYPIFTEAELIAKQFAASSATVNNGGVLQNKKNKYEDLYTPVESILIDSISNTPDNFEPKAIEDDFSKQLKASTDVLKNFSTGWKRKRSRLSSNENISHEDVIHVEKIQKVAENVTAVTKEDEPCTTKMSELCKKFDIKKELGVRLIKIDNSVPKISIKINNASVKQSVEHDLVEERAKRRSKSKISYDELKDTDSPVREPIKTVIRLNLKNKIESKHEKNNNNIREIEKSTMDKSNEVSQLSENEIVQQAVPAATVMSTVDVYEKEQGTTALQQQLIGTSDAASTSKIAVGNEINEILLPNDNQKLVSETPVVVTPRQVAVDRAEADESQKAKLLMLMNATTPSYETVAANKSTIVTEQSPQPQPQSPLIQSPLMLPQSPHQFCILFIPDAMYNSETGAINRDVTPTATIVNFQPVPDNEIATKSLIYTPTTPIKISMDEHAKSYTCGPCTQVLDLIGRLEASLGMTEEDKSTIKCPFCSNHFQSLFYLEYHVMQEHLKCENERQCRHSRLNSLRIPNHEVTSESEIYITFALKCRSCYDVFTSVLTLNDHVMHKHQGLVRLKPSSPSQLSNLGSTLTTLSTFVSKNGSRAPVLQCPSDCVCRIGIRSTDSPLQRQQMLKRCPNAMRRLEKIEPAAYEVYTCTLCQSTFLMKDEVVDHLMKMHEVSCKFPCFTCLTSFRTLQMQENHPCSEVTLQDLDKLLNIAILPGNVSGNSSGGGNGKEGDSKFLEREDSSTDEYGAIKASAATELSPTATTAKIAISTYSNGYKRKNGETIAELRQMLHETGPKRIKMTNQGRTTKYRKRACPKCKKRFAYRKSLHDHIIYEHILKGVSAEGPKKVAVEILKLLSDNRTQMHNGHKKIEELAESLKDCTDEDGLSLRKLMMLDETEQEKSWKEVGASTTSDKQVLIEKDFVPCSRCKAYFKQSNNLGGRGKHKISSNESYKLEQSLCENCENHSGPKTRRRTIVDNGQYNAGATTEIESSQPLAIQSFTCKKCSETFPTSIELKAHKRIVHLKIIEKVHPCEICKKTFSSLRMLEKHKKLHRETALDDSAKTEDEINLSIGDDRLGSVEGCSKNDDVNDSIKKTNASSRRDSSDSSSGRSKEPEEQPLNCSFCEELCSSKVSLKNHLKREHGRRASICQFCNGLLIDTSEVRHMLDYHIVPTKSTPRRTIVKNNGCILQCDEASCLQEDVNELVRTLGKHRLQSLMMYYDFEGKCNNAIMRCPICPELFATRESCRFHYVWIHDDTCLLCDETFRSGSSAFQHKVDAHTSTASYLWCIQRLVTAIVNTLRLDPDQPSHVLYEMITMRLEDEGATNGVENSIESSRCSAEKTGTEQAVPTATDRFLEEVVLSEDQLPDSSNMIEVVIGKEDSEDDLLSMLNLSPNYENHEQHRLPNADAAPPEEEEEEEVIAVSTSVLPTSPLVNVTTTVPASSVPYASGIPAIETYVTSGVCKYKLDNDEEQYVLVVTDEDLATFRDDIGGLAEKISGSCDSLTLEEITEMLRAYFEGLNAGALGSIYSSPR